MKLGKGSKYPEEAIKSDLLWHVGFWLEENDLLVIISGIYSTFLRRNSLLHPSPKYERCISLNPFFPVEPSIFYGTVASSAP
jgi:hypothetical protein